MQVQMHLVPPYSDSTPRCWSGRNLLPSSYCNCNWCQQHEREDERVVITYNHYNHKLHPTMASRDDSFFETERQRLIGEITTVSVAS
jgi:hypothetical protein